MDELDPKNMWFLSIIIMFGVSCHLRNKSGVFSDKDMKSYVNLYIAFSSILFFLCVFIPDPRYIDPSDYIYLFFFGILFVGEFVLGCILFSKMSWKTKLHALYPELESCLFGLLIINFIIILILMLGGILFISDFFKRQQKQRLQKQRLQKQRLQAQRRRQQTTTATANFNGLINV